MTVVTKSLVLAYLMPQLSVIFHRNPHAHVFAGCVILIVVLIDCVLLHELDMVIESPCFVSADNSTEPSMPSTIPEAATFELTEDDHSSVRDHEELVDTVTPVVCETSFDALVHPRGT